MDRDFLFAIAEDEERRDRFPEPTSWQESAVMKDTKTEG
jgi:hypothetical protein